MKPFMLLIEMFLIARWVLPASALVAGEASHPIEAFRSDTTMRFMHKLGHHHSVEAAHGDAARSHACERHGFKASERAGCVAFMRQACNKDSRQADASKDECLHFFQQEQPSYKDLQKGPNYHKGDAQAKSKKESASEKKSERPSSGSADAWISDSGPLGDLQQGPNYDSEKAQKATAEKAEDNKKAKPYSKGLAQKLDPFGGKLHDAAKDAFREAQKGPNYHKEEAQKNKYAKEARKQEQEPEVDDEPEQNEVASVPGCRNKPRGWKDSKGRDCEDYAEGEWCTRRGGYGDAWLDEWGKFEDFATKGKSATDVCCVCGGGLREDEDSSDKAEEEAKKSGEEGGDPGAPAAAPSASPAAAPMGPILGGKARGALQEQGYSGELVAHEDQKTMTDDWGREFGPHAGHRDIKEICAETPGNEWCDLHGYYDKERRSAASSTSLAAVALALMVIKLF